ncbi:hypothetical protein [Streptomyces rimosus]|nr:hypothetical protein [Streptomyces rimosus]
MHQELDSLTGLFGQPDPHCAGLVELDRLRPSVELMDAPYD